MAAAAQVPKLPSTIQPRSRIRVVGQSPASSRMKGRRLRRNPGTGTALGELRDPPRPRPIREGPEGRPQRSGGGHSASPCTPWISGHSPAGKQQLSRDGPAATSPSPCSPPGPRTPRGSASRGSSGPGGVRNHSRSTAPCPEPLQLLGSPPSAVLLAAMPPLLCLALTNSGVSPKRAGVPHSGTRPQTRPH